MKLPGEQSPGIRATLNRRGDDVSAAVAGPFGLINVGDNGDPTHT